MSDLFDLYRMTEFAEFPTLPEELRGIDLEPDYLPPLNIESARVYHYICITYEAGEAGLMNRFAGYNFLRRKKNSYFFHELVGRKNEQPAFSGDGPEGYVLILFEPGDAGKVIEKFQLPFYRKNDTYKLGDLLNHVKLQF